jgi:AcrR family transcriptional regulator
MPAVIEFATLTDNARKRMVHSAALLMREKGVDGTSFSQVLQHSGAPRGSIYHYFPGGKAQLIEEATRYAGDYITAGMAKMLERGDPLAIVEAWSPFWRDILEDSQFSAGCPIVASTLESGQNPAIHAAAADVFRQWVDLLARGLTDRGVPPARARSLSTMAFSSLEGSVILARADRSMEPIEQTLAEVRGLLADALAAAA